jgi:hypothetical protein
MKIKIGPDALRDIELVDDNGNPIYATEIDVKLRVNKLPEVRMVIDTREILLTDKEGKSLTIDGVEIKKHLESVEITGKVKGSG